MYKDVDVKEFVMTWVFASKNKLGKQYVADETGLEYIDVTNLNIALRNKGVQLPPLQKGQKSFLGDTTVLELNELISDELK